VSNEKSFEEKVRERLEQRQGGVDPSLGNHAKRTPKPTDLKDVGRKAYERIKSKVKR
jgi:hypothetical protein